MRFLAGVLGGFALGRLLFGRAMFDVTHVYHGVLEIAPLVAGVLALRRVGLTRGAILLCAAVTLGMTVWAGQVLGLARGLATGAWTAAIGIGALLIAEVYEMLDGLGIRLGKTILVGLLLGGVYLAASPLRSLWDVPPAAVMMGVLRFLWLGLVIGYGVGAGMELVDLLVRGEQPPRAPVEDAPAEAP